MKIILDAMGGDHAPEAVIEGAVQAGRDLDVEILLVGRPKAIEPELARYDTAGRRLPIIPASQPGTGTLRSARACAAYSDQARATTEAASSSSSSSAQPTTHAQTSPNAT